MRNCKSLALALLIVAAALTDAWAAVSRVSGQVVKMNINAATSASLAFTALTNPVGSGNAIVGAVQWDCTGGNVLISVTDNQSNTYSLGTSFTDTTNNQCGRAFWLGNITNGPTTVTATFSGTPGFRGGVLREYTGVDPSTNPTDGNTGQFQNAPGTGANAVTSGSVVTTLAGDGIVGLTFSTGGSSGNISAGSGFTIDQMTAGDVANEDQTQSSAGSIAATFTIASGSQMITMLVALKASGAPPPSGGPTRRTMTGVGK